MLWNSTWLVVSLFDKVSKPNPPDLQPNSDRVIYKCHFLEKPKLCKNERNKSDIFESNSWKTKWSFHVPNCTESLQNALELSLAEV